jgi:hypothetical protein
MVYFSAMSGVCTESSPLSYHSGEVYHPLAAILCAAWLLIVTGIGLWAEVQRIKTPLADWLDHAAKLLNLGRGA